MPELTIASAVLRTTCSLTLQANLFQLFQPIGGVSASPFGALLTTSCVVSAIAGAASRFTASANHRITLMMRAIPLPSPSALALALPSGDATRERGESWQVCVRC